MKRTFKFSFSELLGEREIIQCASHHFFRTRGRALSGTRLTLLPPERPVSSPSPSHTLPPASAPWSIQFHCPVHFKDKLEEHYLPTVPPPITVAFVVVSFTLLFDNTGSDTWRKGTVVQQGHVFSTSREMHRRTCLYFLQFMIFLVKVHLLRLQGREKQTKCIHFWNRSCVPGQALEMIESLWGKCSVFGFPPFPLVSLQNGIWEQSLYDNISWRCRRERGCSGQFVDAAAEWLPGLLPGQVTPEEGPTHITKYFMMTFTSKIRRSSI